MLPWYYTILSHPTADHAIILHAAFDLFISDLGQTAENAG